MDATKAVPKKRGPKPKPTEEQLQQLTVRLTPKLKFGLELLARAQHRSLSQAVEWALQRGLNAFRLPGSDGASLSDLVDALWQEPSAAKRALLLHAEAPELLSFEEATACALVAQSEEVREIEESYREAKQQAIVMEEMLRQADAGKAEAARDRDREVLSQLLDANWTMLVQISTKRMQEAKPMEGLCLLELLGFARGRFTSPMSLLRKLAAKGRPLATPSAITTP